MVDQEVNTGQFKYKVPRKVDTVQVQGPVTAILPETACQHTHQCADLRTSLRLGSEDAAGTLRAAITPGLPSAVCPPGQDPQARTKLVHQLFTEKLSVTRTPTQPPLIQEMFCNSIGYNINPELQLLSHCFPRHQSQQ